MNEQKKNNERSILSDLVELIVMSDEENKLITQRDSSHVLEISNIHAYNAAAFLTQMYNADTQNDIPQEILERLSDKYILGAMVDGKMVTHEISKKDYNKFFALDNTHQLMLFNKVWGLDRGDTERVPDISAQLQEGGSVARLQAHDLNKGEITEPQLIISMNPAGDVLDHDFQVRNGGVSATLTQKDGHYYLFATAKGGGALYEIPEMWYNNAVTSDPNALKKEGLLKTLLGLLHINEAGETVAFQDVAQLNHGKILNDNIQNSVEKPITPNWNVEELSNRVSATFEKLTPESEDMAVGLRR